MESLYTETRNGYTLKIEYEQFADDPCNWGNFTVKHWRDVEGVDAEEHKVLPELQAKLDDGRAFWVDKYEHGNSVYSLAGSGMQYRFDTSSSWGIIELDDEYVKGVSAEDRRKYAKGDLETYTDWANGDVYRAEITDEYGEYIDGMGDIYGLEYAIAEGKSNLDHLAPTHSAAAAPRAQALHS